MRNEVDAAANFIAANLSLGSNEASSFVDLFSTTLTERYTGHWHAGEPERGSAFRVLTRSGHAVDQLILDAAARATNLDVSQVRKLLSKSMQSDRWTLWIDPGCVSIRLHEGGATSFHSLDQATKSSAAIAGIREIWGKLPASLVGASASAATSSVERPKTPFNRNSKDDEVHAAAMSEFAELIKEANASPSKRSKAIAIVRPGSVSAALASADPARAAATPPRPPLPPLHFTIQESTSPYVPSFAAPSAGAAHIASSATPSNSTTPTPLASSPLAAAVSATSESASSDPFARPSSRSSTTSAESAVSCSIFSHSSSESRSSSIGSYSTMASSVLPSIASVIPKATQHEMNQAAMFTFPNALSGMTAGAKSVPASPSKPRRGAPRHQHTLSTSSAISTASLASAASGASVAHPGHQRARSSQSNIRVSANAGTVQDYSNGKVGVLGGGVLLGLGNKSSSSSSSADRNTRNSSRPGPRPTSASSSSSSNGGGERQRSKSRTPSASGSISGAAGYPMWYNQHQYHPVPPMNQHWMQGQA